MERVILHVDMNSFFASVACIGHPEWKRVPMAVAGPPQVLETSEKKSSHPK